MPAPTPVRKARAAKAVVIVAVLTFALAMIAWRCGVFGPDPARPDPAAPPAIVETPEQKTTREEIEQAIHTTEARGDAPTGSS
jgi:hypothetical protein